MSTNMYILETNIYNNECRNIPENFYVKILILSYNCGDNNDGVDD